MAPVIRHALASHGRVTRNTSPLTAPLGARPFGAAQHQAAKRVQAAQSRLPNRPDFKHFPTLSHYTPAQRHLILRSQGARVQQALAREGHFARAAHGGATPMERLYANSSPHDQAALRLLGRVQRGDMPHKQAVDPHLIAHAPTPRGKQAPASLLAALRPRVPTKGLGHATSAPSSMDRLLQRPAPLDLGRGGTPRAYRTPDTKLTLGIPGVAAFHLPAASPHTFLGRGWNEAWDMPGQMVSSAGELGHGLLDVATGKGTKRLEGIGHGFTDMLRRYRDNAGNEFSQHPFSTALMLVPGGGGVAGRVAGAVARTGKLGARAAEFAKLARDPRVLYAADGAQSQLASAEHALAQRTTEARDWQNLVNARRQQVAYGHGDPFELHAAEVEHRRAMAGMQQAAAAVRRVRQQPAPPLAIERHYSPNLIHQAGQRGLERLQRSRGLDPNQALGRVALSQLKPLDRMLAGRSIESHIKGGLLRPGLVDRAVAQGDAYRRRVLGQALPVVRNDRPKVGADAVVPMVEGVIRRPMAVQLADGRTLPSTLVEDLHKEAARLRAAGEGLTRGEKRANSASVKQIEGLLHNKEFLKDPSAAWHSAQQYLIQHRPMERELAQLGHISEEQLRAKYFPYAQAHMGARRGQTTLSNGELGSAMVGADGRVLPTAAIRQHMAANGVGEPGFVSHDPNLTGAGSYFMPSFKRPLPSGTRSGRAFDKGLYDRSYAALEAQVARSSNLIAGHHGWADLLNTFGVGRHANRIQAQNAAKAFMDTPEGQRLGHEMAPTWVGPDKLVQSGGIAPREDSAALDALKTAGEGVPHGAVPHTYFTNLPKPVVERLKEHEKGMGPDMGRRLAQRYLQHWRATQLFTSPRWLFGNPQEHLFRLTIGGVGPKSYAVGRKLKAAADALEREGGANGRAVQRTAETLMGGAQYAAHTRNSLYRASEQFVDQAGVYGVLSNAERLAGTPVGHQLLHSWETYKRGVGWAMSQVEHRSRVAAFGKVAQEDVRRLVGRQASILKMTDEQIKEYVRTGAVNPNWVNKMSRAQDELMGNWQNLTPAVRRAVQGYAPFGLWWLTSMRYLTHLPINHPIKTAIGAALYRATEQQRHAEGQGLPNTPEWLRGGIPVNIPGVGKQTWTPGYYTPLSAPDPKTMMDMVYPQFTDTFFRGRGLDALTGSQLDAPGPNGKPQKMTPGQTSLSVLYSLLEGITPGMRQARQWGEGGGTPYATSMALRPQVKPGTATRSLEQRLFKLLAPSRFYSPPRKKNSGGGAGGWSYGGASGGSSGGWSYGSSGSGSGSGGGSSGGSSGWSYSGGGR